MPLDRLCRLESCELAQENHESLVVAVAHFRVWPSRWWILESSWRLLDPQLGSLVVDGGRSGHPLLLFFLGPNADMVTGLAAVVATTKAVAPRVGACGSYHRGFLVDSTPQLAKALGNQNIPVEVVDLHAAALVPVAAHERHRAAEGTSCVGDRLGQAACADKPRELAQTPVLEMTPG